jgi:CDP-6-deoxy-D-xylo-4-hexulose-3-dehydrase
MKNTFYEEEEVKKKLCDFILNSDRLSMSKKCKEFEERFSEYQGRNYSVLVNSGSSANLLLIQALLNKGDLKKGDKVGFSALTWSTNVMPLIQLGLVPIPIDVNPTTLCVSPSTFENALRREGNGMKALFLTNLLGFQDDGIRIAEICEDCGILLLEDNCESLGSVGKEGFTLGNYGYASTFSFFVGHHLSTIEGGMICTNDIDLYNHLVMARCHGWSRDVDDFLKSDLREANDIEQFYDCYTFYTVGMNLRPTEITGFLGCEQLDHITKINNIRSGNYRWMKNAAEGNEKIKPLCLFHMEFVSNFAFPIIYKDKKTRDIAIDQFKEAGIEVRPIVGGSILEQPFFCDKKSKKCPNAREIHECGLYVPNNPDLTVDELELICCTIAHSGVEK